MIIDHYYTDEARGKLDSNKKDFVYYLEKFEAFK